MIRVYTSLLFIYLFFTGCGISNIDKPLPYEYESWHKNGVSKLDVFKALLECDFGNPFGGLTEGRNNIVLNYRCMEKIGYKYTGDCGKQICEDKKWSNLPACSLPWSEIPDRSVAKRLNSPYCKQYPEAEACQRNDNISNEKPAPQQQLKTQDVPISQEDEFLKQLRQQQEKEHFNSLKQMIPKVHK